MNRLRKVFLLLFAALTVSVGCEQTPRADAPAQKSETTAPASSPVSRSAESGPVRVTVEIDRDVALAPDPITMTLTVEAERGVTVTMPEIGELLGDFLVQRIEKTPLTEDDMYRREAWTILLEPALPGEASIPPITVGYEDRRERVDGSRADVADRVESPALVVRVEQHLADVKDPASIIVPTSYTLLAWFLGVVAVVAAAALLARWLKRDPSPVSRPAAPSVPAHLWALAQLDMLAAEGLLDRGRVQEWYYRINAIVRQYIERRFGLLAGEQTSEEFLRDLQRTAILSPEHKQLLQRFVRACDPVKYARHQPDAAEIQWVDASARNFVLQTAETAGSTASVSPSGPGVVPARPVEQESAT